MVSISENNKKYICKYCKKEFESPYKLGGHTTRCQLNPNYLNSLKQLENARNNINYKKLNKINICYCQYCGGEYKSLNSLKQHECRCKENPNKIDLTYLSNRNYSNFNFNPSNQYIKAKQEGRTIELSDETRYKLGNSWRGKEMPQEYKDKISKAMQKAVREHPDSYFGINTNKRVKKYLYNDIWLDGKWELIFAQYLDKLNIKWERPRKGIEYIWENKNHIYYPDFYLTDYNLYVEVKGQETERDHIKWKNVKKLLVIRLNEIKKIKRNTYNIFEYLNKLK